MINDEITNHRSQASMITKAMKDCFEEVKFRHTRREKNSDAHMLARIVIKDRKATDPTETNCNNRPKALF